MPLVIEHFGIGKWGNEADKFLNKLSKNLLTLKEDQMNMALETDGEGSFQFYYSNVIVLLF